MTPKFVVYHDPDNPSRLFSTCHDYYWDDHLAHKDQTTKVEEFEDMYEALAFANTMRILAATSEV